MGIIIFLILCAIVIIIVVIIIAVFITMILFTTKERFNKRLDNTICTFLNTRLKDIINDIIKPQNNGKSSDIINIQGYEDQFNLFKTKYTSQPIKDEILNDFTIKSLSIWDYIITNKDKKLYLPLKRWYVEKILLKKYNYLSIFEQDLYIRYLYFITYIHIVLLKIKTEFPNIITSFAIIILAIGFKGSNNNIIIWLSILYSGVIIAIIYIIISILISSPSDKNNRDYAINCLLSKWDEPVKTILTKKTEKLNFKWFFLAYLWIASIVALASVIAILLISK